MTYWAREGSDVRNATRIAILVLVGGLLLLASPALAAPACSVTQAKRDVSAAKKAVRRANHRLAEAKLVLSATRHYSEAYGTSVGRWSRLARRVGWGWGCFPQLMYIINRESHGNPNAKNPASTASGLMQFLSFWWAGKWNPFDPQQNLLHGRKAWQQQGFAPWAL